MSQPDSEHPVPTGGIKAALVAAGTDTYRLLSGPGKSARWKALWSLAAMAGVVGVGSAPPPLGLLQPVWADPALRSSVFDNPVVIRGLIGLAVFLVLMGGISRGFTLAFAESIATAAPTPGRYRSWVGKGVAHYVWSSALTLPLYGVLFAAEALVTRDAAEQWTALLGSPDATEGELTAMMFAVLFKFLVVLAPWTLLTLPAMVAAYELTPSVMARTGKGPVAAFGLVRELGRKSPKRLLGYFGMRLVLQLIGNVLALVALRPSLLISAPLTVPLGGGGWLLSQSLGGFSTGSGSAVATVGILLACLALYCALCAVLLPLSVFIFAFAGRLVSGE